MRVAALAEDSQMTLSIPPRFLCFEYPFSLGCIPAVTWPGMIKAELLPAKMQILLCSTHFILYFSSSDSSINHRIIKISTWKEPTRITRSNSWLCPGKPQEFRPCHSYYLIPPMIWQAQENGFTLWMQISEELLLVWWAAWKCGTVSWYLPGNFPFWDGLQRGCLQLCDAVQHHKNWSEILNYCIQCQKKNIQLLVLNSGLPLYLKFQLKINSMFY